MPIFQDILKNIFKGGDGKIAEIIKETADELIYTKEEKAQAEAEHEKWAEENAFRNKILNAEIAQKEVDNYLKTKEIEVEDRKSARVNETEIAKAAPTKLWGLTVNIRSIIAVGTVIFTFLIFFLIFFRKADFSQTQYNLLFLVLGNLLSSYRDIYNYFFGSSDSSKSKDDIIKQTINKNV